MAAFELDSSPRNEYRSSQVKFQNLSIVHALPGEITLAHQSGTTSSIVETQAIVDDAERIEQRVVRRAWVPGIAGNGGERPGYMYILSIRFMG